MKDWNVVKDSEEYETLRKQLTAIRETGGKLTRSEAGRLGGISTRQKYGYQGFRDAGRASARARHERKDERG